MTTKTRTPKSNETTTNAAATDTAGTAHVQEAKAQGPVLVEVAGKEPRAGTASAACYSALLSNIGQPREIVLEALKQAETSWHASQGRKVKGVAPSGWLRTHKAQFAD